MKIGIIGVNGKINKLLKERVESREDVILSGVVSCRDNNNFENEVKELLNLSDIVIDFTTPKTSLRVVQVAKYFEASVLIGTTGFNKEQQAELKNHAKQACVLKCSNTSPSINNFIEVVNTLAQEFGEGARIKISETHHINKKDEPSGTALMLKDVIKYASPKFFNANIEISSNRESNPVGYTYHSVSFCNNNERISVSHSIDSPEVYADGAIDIALEYQNNPCGLLQ